METVQFVSAILKWKQFNYTYIIMYDNVTSVQEEAHPPPTLLPYHDCKITWSTSTLLAIA